MEYKNGDDKNKQKDNLLKRKNKIDYSLNKSSSSLSSSSSSLFRNSILLFPSALGIEIICILSSLIGESIGFYLFGFNPIGIIYAYSLGFLVAGFTIFLVIVGRYKEHKNINLGCHDDCNGSYHQFQVGFKSNFITTFKYFKNGWFNLPTLFYNPNRSQLLKRALYLLLTAESVCVITAQTVDLLFYNFSVFLSIPMALIAGAVVISFQQAEEINKKNNLKRNKPNKDHNNGNIKNNNIRLQFKIVPIALSVNALLILLFVVSGGYNHYDNTATYSKYHTHIMNSENETFFSAPDIAVIETDEQGIGINLDYLSIVKSDSNPINKLLNIPSSRHIINTSIISETHPDRNIRFNNNQSIHLDFYECHNKGCNSPQEIINVFMTNNNTLDKKIIEDKLKDNEKILFVNSSEFTFEPNLSQYNIMNNHHKIFDKLVIHTKQKENIEAIYLSNVNLTNKFSH